MSTEIEQKIDVAKAEKDGLLAELTAVVSEIVNCNQRLLTTLPIQEYQRVASKRARLVNDRMQIDLRMAAAKRKIAELEHGRMQVKQEDKQADKIDQGFITKIRELRDYYQAFSADPSRVSSMRAMAGEFAMKLTPIIRDVIQHKSS